MSASPTTRSVSLPTRNRPPRGVAILADAGRRIGTGHVHRAVALAAAFEAAGAQARLLTPTDGMAPALARALGRSPVELPPILSAGYPAALGLALDRAGLDLIILDLWPRELRAHGFLADRAAVTTVSIALLDFPHPRFEDLSIHPSPAVLPHGHRRGSRGGVVPVLSGPAYLVVDPAYHAIPDRAPPPVARRILVTLGGTDPKGLTEAALELLGRVREPLEITVLAGRMPGRATALRGRPSPSHHRVEVLPAVEDMPRRMAETDLVVLSGGATRYEAAAAGTPFAALSINRTQAGFTEGLTRQGAGLHLGIAGSLEPAPAAAALEALILDPGRRGAFARIGRSLVAPGGASRIAAAALDAHARKD
jgi:UDP-2,4-diacetamido-2,4,6-trideoxy-beta-L-altropyranose hydrolase